jgi:hypothetical protein
MFANDEDGRSRNRQAKALVSLMDRIASNRASWSGPTAIELRLLREVTSVTCFSLPDGCYTSASVMLGFLVRAQYLLENRASALGEVLTRKN